MKALRDFYEYKGRLLHANQNFLGYDPMISIPMDLPKIPKPGEGKSEHIFVVGNEAFRVVLAAGMFYGPLRGYRREEVWRNEKLIISTCKGKAPSAAHPTGKSWFIEGERAYKIVDWFALKDFRTDRIYWDLDPEKYYLLVFDGVTLPVVFPQSEVKPAVEKETYTREELEPYRQKTWEGLLQVGPDVLRVVSEEVPGFGFSFSSGITHLYRKCKWWRCLRKKELSIGGNRFEFDCSL